MKNLDDIILKHALLNAAEHEGKANANAVLGKVIAEIPEIKNKISETMKNINAVVAEVNSLSLEEQREKIKRLGVKRIARKKEEKYELPELLNAKIGKVITAFPPEPSKYPHLGHAKAALINYLYAKKYKGKFVLRFEDSNPDLAKKEYYEEILSGLKWLGIKWDKLDYLSNHLPEYYESVEILLKKDSAYVCLCKQETIKKERAAGETCEHRKQNAKENLKLWKKMFKKIKPGQATVRMKIDMQHLNTTLRDPSIIKISDTIHPRTRNKYRLWPLYDFATAMLDVWEGITHRVRTKEFELRADLQEHIRSALGYKSPVIIEMGRFQIKGAITKGREIRELILNKKLLGWDDPRLTTLIALKRRGFAPEAITDFLLSTGLTKAEAELEWEALESFNRKKIDANANRYFAALSPVKISIDTPMKDKTVKILMHPDFPKRGYRKLPLNAGKIYIEKADYENYQNKNIGLINIATINLNSKAKFISKKIDYGAQKIQWISEPNVKIKIITSDGKIRNGIGEINMKKLKVGQLIQLVRIGFCRVDKVNKDIVLYYAHK